MASAGSKATVKHAATDVYCNFELAVRKSRSRSKASSRASVKQRGAERKEK